MDVTVTFPGEILVASKEDVEQFRQRVVAYTLGHLYHQGKVSAGYASQMLGCDRWEFFRLLSEIGIPALDYAPEDLTREGEFALR